MGVQQSLPMARYLFLRRNYQRKAIRWRWMLEEDLIEAIIALPTQLFYNTDIGAYIFILSRNKRPDVERCS